MTLRPSNFTVQLLFILTIILCSCSSTYKPVNLQAISNWEKSTRDGIEFSYVHSLQRISDNGWYFKKERKFQMVAVGVTITNNSSVPVVITRDNFRVLTEEGTEKKFLTPEEYTKNVKQRTGRHLLHALWGPWAISWQQDANGNTDFNFIYLPVGALVGIGNALRARNANAKNFRNLEMMALWDKILKPGETVQGIILINGFHGEDLKFELTK